jgi:HAD superfamily hydrolase (TIGR01549 family)
MLRGVLVDLGNVLIVDDIDLAQSVAGIRHGLAAIGRAEQTTPKRLLLRFQRALAENGPRRTHEHDLAGPLRRELAGLVGDDVSDGEAEAFLLASHRHLRRFQRFHPDGADMLHGLRRRGVPTAVVSNTPTPRTLLQSLLDDLGIGPLVDTTVFSSDGHRRKPCPDMFLLAAEGLGVTPGECLMVGDKMYEDIGGASQVGMPTMLVTWAGGDPGAEVTAPAGFVAATAGQALRHIDGLRAADRAGRQADGLSR